MPSSPHLWFVQTDFGALLGPMPQDALAEMARTGALLIRDRVREGTEGEWRPAGDVPGLFDETTPQLGLMSSQLEDLFAPQAPQTRQSTSTKRANWRADQRAIHDSTAASSNELDFESDAPLIAPPPTDLSSLAADESRFDLDFDVPLAAPLPMVTPSPIAAPRETKPSPAPIPPAVSLPTDPTLFSIPIPTEPTEGREPEPIQTAPAGWQARTSRTPRWQPAARKTTRWPGLDKRTALMGAIAVVGLIALTTAWWLWPRQRPDLYANYVAIYKELQQRQANSQDQAGWSEFSTRAKSQLDATIPWLEERAKPGDREKSLLLYAGRDLQELLDQPRNSKNPHQKRLAAFFEQLQEIYGSK